MPSPINIRELRYLSGTTFNTAFVNADDAAWAAGTAVKLKVQTLELSGLVYEGAEDATLQQRLLAASPNIPTIRTGGIKFSTFLGSGSANATANPEATLLSKVFGGLASPGSDKTDLADSSGTHTTTRVYATGIGANVQPGMAVLLGTRGDGRGNGRVYPISAEGTDYIDLGIATPLALADGDAIVVSHTVYVDDSATQSYLDFLAIGQDADDQIQAIGCMGGVALSGMKPGELPTIEYDLMVGDWREVSVAGNADQLEPSVAMSGTIPPVDRGLGGFFLGDSGSTTVDLAKIDGLSIEPGLAYEVLPDPNGVNGRGGWVKVTGRAKATFSILLDGSNANILPGLYNDFADNPATGKQLLAQFGHSAQRCCAIEFPKFYLDASPKRAAVGALAALEVAGHGDIGATTTALTMSPIRFHWF